MAALGTEAAIADALSWYVSGLTTVPPTGISAPGVSFTPSANRDPYLSVSILPNMADLTGLAFDNEVLHRGLLQVSVFWKSGAGIVKPMDVASQVVARFKPGTRIDRNGLTIKIDEQPRVAPPIVEADWTSIPITIRWWVCAPAN